VSGIVGLGGGIGASRLWRPLVAAVEPSRLTLVVNTADDLWIHGLYVCPDLDTTLYALSGRQDLVRGWGVADESFRCMGALSALGRKVWFSLGDLDLATHLMRTELLRAGVRLVEITQQLADAMGVRTRILPMTEDAVTTRIRTPGGRLHYQEYLVQHGARPSVLEVCHEGASRASPAAGVMDAIGEAELIILAPSNPVASISPILAVGGIREAICRTAAPVVAVSPIVSGVPISDPAEQLRADSRAALLGALGVPATASGVADHYRDLVDRYVLDIADAAEADAVRAMGIDVAAVPTLLHSGAPPDELIDAVLGQRH
jgi:LPPG:FO 2-phospho-L-lactate transferase